MQLEALSDKHYIYPAIIKVLLTILPHFTYIITNESIRM